MNTYSLAYLKDGELLTITIKETSKKKAILEFYRKFIDTGHSIELLKCKKV